MKETSTPVTLLKTEEITGASGGAAEIGGVESKPKASDNKNVALNLPLANFILIIQSLSK